MDQLANYLSYFNWDYLFALIAVIGLFGGLAALISGIYRTGMKYIVEGILIVLLVFLTQPLVSYLASLDISGLVGSSISLNGQNITVTTVDETLVQYIESLGLISSATDPSLDLIALQLAHSLLGFVVFIVGLLLIGLLGPLISLIIYSFTFMVFIPKEVRKHKKHRFISFATGFVCSAVIGALFLAPFTSITSTLSSAASEIKTAESNNTIDSNNLTDYQALIDLLASYQNSAYYQAMTLGGSAASAGLDTKIMDQVTAMTVSGSTVYASDEAAAILGLFPQIVSSIKNTGSGISIDYDKLLAPSTVSGIIDSLSSWKVLMSLIPVFAEIGLSQSGLSEQGIDIDLSDVSWTGTFSDIDYIYGQLYSAGLISEYVLPSLSGDPVPSSFTFDYSKKDNYVNAVEKVAGMDLFKNNIPKMLASQAKSFSESSDTDYLSTLVSSYQALDLSDDLGALTEFVFDAFRILGYTSLTSDSLSNMTGNLLDALSDSGKASNIKALFCGGDIVFDGSDGAAAVTVSDYKGLLGLDFLSSGVLKIGKFVSSMLGQVADISQYVSDATITKLGNDLADADNLKNEFGIILDILPDLTDLSDNSLDITDQTTRDNLDSMLAKAQNSVIIADILPDFLESVLSTQSMQDMLFGLSASDFDFNPTDSAGKSILIPQIRSLLTVVGEAVDLSDEISNSSGGSSSEVLSSIDTADLKSVLTAIISNKVINPDRRLSGTGTYVSNVNFDAMIESLFSNESLADIGLTVPSDLSSIVWLDTEDSLGNVTSEGEITKLCAAIDVIKDNIGFFTSGSISISDLSGTMVKSIFNAIGASALLSSSLSSIMNDNVAPLIADLGVEVNFNNLDWASEADSFASVIDCLNALGTSDLSSIDWTDIDSSKVNALLTSLSKTGIFRIQKDDNGYYVDKFGELMHTLISKVGLTSDMIGDSLTEDNFSIVGDKYTGAVKAGFSSWSGTVSAAGLDEDGEISKIAGIFDAIHTVGLSSLSNGSATGSELTSFLTSIEASRVFSPALPYLINYAVSGLSDVTLTDGDKIEFSAINGLALQGMSESEVDDEIDSIGALYDEFADSSSLSSLLSSPTDLASESAIMPLEDMLNTMAGLKMLTTVKTGNQYSFFTEFMASLIHSTTLDEMITGESDSAKARTEILPRIASIADWTFDQSLTNEQRKSATGSEILRITQVLREIITDHITIASLTDPQGIASDAVKNLLTGINSSELLHPAVAEFFTKIFTAMSINSYLSISGVQYRTVDTRVHLDYSVSSISYWDNEIDGLSELFTAIKDVSSGGSLNLSGIHLGGSGIEIYSFIHPLDSMNLFADSKEYIVYNFLNTNAGGKAVTDFLDADDYTYSSGFVLDSDKAEHIRALLFPDLHDDAWLETQCTILDSFINNLTSISDVDFQSTDPTDQASLESISYNLIMSTMKLSYDASSDVTTYTRCYLAEDLVAGLLYDNFRNDTLLDSDAVSSFFHHYFYAASGTDETDYLYMNIVAARGLQGIMSLYSIGSYGSTKAEHDAFKANILRVFTLMGRTVGTADVAYSTADGLTQTEADTRNALLKQAEANLSLTRYVSSDLSTRLNNSRIAITLFDTYADRIYIDNAHTYTLKQAMLLAGCDYHAMSFEACAAQFNSVVGTIPGI